MFYYKSKLSRERLQYDNEDSQLLWEQELQLDGMVTSKGVMLFLTMQITSCFCRPLFLFPFSEK